jgi:chorismate-pyruvate lyase
MIRWIYRFASFGLSVGLLVGAGPVRAADAAPASDYVTRLELLALMQTLTVELLTHDSATLTLEHWCEAHHLASPARIVADRVSGADKIATPQQREELGVTAAEPLRYRRVRLRCGEHVLSEADNWYVPSRLTADMNALLDTSDTPFGKVVQGLHFQRRTVSSTQLWSPLPEGWEMQSARAAGPTPRLGVPGAILQNKAILSLPDGTPFSEVLETYSDQVLAFRLPQRP